MPKTIQEQTFEKLYQNTLKQLGNADRVILDPGFVGQISVKSLQFILYNAMYASVTAQLIQNGPGSLISLPYCVQGLRASSASFGDGSIINSATFLPAKCENIMQYLTVQASKTNKLNSQALVDGLVQACHNSLGTRLINAGLVENPQQLLQQNGCTLLTIKEKLTLQA